MTTEIAEPFSQRALAKSRDIGIDRSAVPLLLGFILLLGVGGVIVWLVNSSRTQSELVLHVTDVQRTASRVYRNVQAAETGQRGFLLTGDPSYLQPYTTAIEYLPIALNGLAAATEHDPEQSREVADIRGWTEQKMAELARTVSLQQAGDTAQALDIVKGNSGRDLMVQIRGAIDHIQERASRQIEVEYEEGQGLNNALLFATGGALVAILILGALVIRLNRRAIDAVNSSRVSTEQQNELLEQAVAERTAELTETNEEVQRFAYIVSHDLRAPLVNIMGFTSELETLKSDLVLAGSKPSDDPMRTRADLEFTESIGFIKAAIDKMEGLIAAILRLSRDGRRTFKPEQIETAKLIGGLADAQRHQTDSAGATVSVHRDLPRLVADRLALEQIFGNLLDNAIKYLDPTRAGMIEVTGETIGGRARINVSDNGRGIAEHDHRRVFELFRRSGEQNRPGDGIGLAHVQTLVRSLGGRITLASELGKGTTFTVILPLAPKNYVMNASS